MPHKIKIRKGLNIPLKGKAEKTLIQVQEQGGLCALKPEDFPSITPKAAIKEGDAVKAGEVVFYSKSNPEVKFTSPISGTLKSIIRGERRKILEFVIEPDGKKEYQKFAVENFNDFSREKVIELMLLSCTWPFIRQRPFDIIANPVDIPKSIFISGFDSSPLAPDYDYILQGQEGDFQKGIDALRKLTKGSIHVTINGKYPVNKFWNAIKGIELNTITGPHPAGNIGTQIHHISPLNKGELVWFINPQDLLIVGRLFNKGIFDATKIIALTGSEVLKPKYYKIIGSASIESIIKGNITEGNHRFVSGNPLTGTQIQQRESIGFYHNQITVLPDGNHYEFLGWALPGLNKFSFNRSYFSWLTPKREFKIDTNIHGGKRALMITGNFEKVFPMDIYPMQLLKAIIIEDIDLMERLGIYEVAEEDFALCEFIDTSKTDIQSIVRNGLDLMIREMN